MKIRRVHSWNTTPREAAALQRRLRALVSLEPLRREIRLVAVTDAAYDKTGCRVRGAVCVMTLPDFDVVEERTAERETGFPYIPGLLTFREGPVLLECFSRLKTAPDVVLFDGQGIMHPRRMGIASHLGLFLDRPTVGCAKSRLFGTFEEPEPGKGSASPVFDEGGETIGACLRTRAGVKPVFVSPGHRIDLAGAVEVILACCGRFRIPEPLRRAHRLAERTGPAHAVL